jgi:hypothetical protein
MHLRFETQFMDRHTERLLSQRQFIPADPGFRDQSGSFHRSRDCSADLIGRMMIRADEQNPLIGPDQLNGCRGNFLLPSGRIFRPHHGQY